MEIPNCKKNICIWKAYSIKNVYQNIHLKKHKYLQKVRPKNLRNGLFQKKLYKNIIPKKPGQIINLEK